MMLKDQDGNDMMQNRDMRYGVKTLPVEVKRCAILGGSCVPSELSSDRWTLQEECVRCSESASTSQNSQRAGTVKVAAVPMLHLVVLFCFRRFSQCLEAGLHKTAGDASKGASSTALKCCRGPLHPLALDDMIVG